MIRVDASKAQGTIRNMQVNLGGPEFRKAAARALNHTMAKGKTAVNAGIRDTYKIPSAEVSKRLFSQNSSPSTLAAMLWASIAPLPLAMFNPVQLTGNVVTKWKGSRKKGGFVSSIQKKGNAGVTVEIMRGQKKTIRTAFLGLKNAKGSVRAFGKYGGDGFEFAGEQGGPTSTLKTLSVYWAIQHDNVAEGVTAGMGAQYAERYEHELARICSRLK